VLILASEERQLLIEDDRPLIVELPAEALK